MYYYHINIEHNEGGYYDDGGLFLASPKPSPKALCARYLWLIVLLLMVDPLLVAFCLYITFFNYVLMFLLYDSNLCDLTI